MPEFNFKPDVIVHLDRDNEQILVGLSEGGDQFPWAEHNGKVIIGPPRGVLMDGTPMRSLAWNTDQYWVIEALDSSGDNVELTPEEYRQAVTVAGSN